MLARPARSLTRASSAAFLLLLSIPVGPASAQTPPPGPPAASPAVAPSPDHVVARVDGQPITERDLAIAAEDLGQQMPQQLSPAQRREYLTNYLTDLKLAAKAASDMKLDGSSEFKARLAYFRDKVLVDEFLAAEAKKAVNDEAMRKLYDETMKNATPEMEARARHILVEGEGEARKIYERLTVGKEDFAALAKELSKDPGSGREGGDLGYFSKDRMVPEFAEAAFKLEPGQISEPVKSQFGWHVIKLEDKRLKPMPPFEQVQAQIEQYLTRKAHTELILALREKGKVEKLDPPPAAPPPAASVPAPAPAAPKQ